MESSKITIPETVTPDRADRVISQLPGITLTRSQIARLIRSGLILVNEKKIQPSVTINPGDAVEFLHEEIPTQPLEEGSLLDIRIIMEDDDVIVIDKPPGVSVHPGAGRASGTLMDIIVASRPGMVGVGDAGRWGVVHRLDKDTSGVMVMAKNGAAHAALSALFKEHSIHRIYLALVRGNPGKEAGVIDTAIGRHPKDRKRISTHSSKKRHAVTNWKVAERFGNITLLEIAPETGRTHQIRVHLASIGLPVAGDQVYGRVRKDCPARDACERIAIKGLTRQALHAHVLGFEHPSRGYLEFVSDLPEDMVEVINRCREEMAGK
jgi:23S rRNA pseudouridine1911/1915/1917 synthase